MKLLNILFLIFSVSFISIASTTPKELLTLEKEILREVNTLTKKDPLKTYELILLLGREFYSYGDKEKALEYYEKALSFDVKVDKTEALLYPVLISMNDKPLALKKLERLKNYRQDKKIELDHWIVTIESYLKGNTVIPGNIKSPFYIWARDNQIAELIDQKEFEKAFRLLGPLNMESLNINSQIRYDLLAATVLKKVPAKLWCEDSLKEYPTSITWSMRICRYLRDQRDRKKPTETIQGIKKQLEKESPDRLSWIHMLEVL